MHHLVNEVFLGVVGTIKQLDLVLLVSHNYLYQLSFFCSPYIVSLFW